MRTSLDILWHDTYTIPKDTCIETNGAYTEASIRPMITINSWSRDSIVAQSRNSTVMNSVSVPSLRARIRPIVTDIYFSYIYSIIYERDETRNENIRFFGHMFQKFLMHIMLKIPAHPLPPETARSVRSKCNYTA